MQPFGIDTSGAHEPLGGVAAPLTSQVSTSCALRVCLGLAHPPSPPSSNAGEHHEQQRQQDRGRSRGHSDRRVAPPAAGVDRGRRRRWRQRQRGPHRCLLILEPPTLRRRRVLPASAPCVGGRRWPCEPPRRGRREGGGCPLYVPVILQRPPSPSPYLLWEAPLGPGPTLPPLSEPPPPCARGCGSLSSVLVTACTSHSESPAYYVGSTPTRAVDAQACPFLHCNSSIRLCWDWTERLLVNSACS